MQPVPFLDAIAAAKRRKVILPNDYYGKIPLDERSQSASIAGLSSLAQIEDVIGSLNRVLEAGGTFADFQNLVSSSEIRTDLSRARLDNIFRTNIQTAYNKGRYKQQMENLIDRPYLMYDAINDSRTRPTHLAMDNTILPADDSWWDTHYPPNGYRCRCTVISLTRKQAIARGGSTENPLEGGIDKGFESNPGKEYARPIKELLADARGRLVNLVKDKQVLRDAELALTTVDIAADLRAAGFDSFGPDADDLFIKALDNALAKNPDWFKELNQLQLRTLYGVSNGEAAKIASVLNGETAAATELIDTLSEEVKKIPGQGSHEPRDLFVAIPPSMKPKKGEIITLDKLIVFKESPEGLGNILKISAAIGGISLVDLIIGKNNGETLYKRGAKFKVIDGIIGTINVVENH